MKALSIRQPWAHAILHLGKDIENRTWVTAHDGLLVVHAAKTVDRPAVEILRDMGEPVPDRPVTGALLGTVRVVGCVSGSGSWWAERGAWHWKLSDPRPFDEPIPWRGLPGLFDVPDDVLAAVVTSYGRPPSARRPCATNRRREEESQ